MPKKKVTLEIPNIQSYDLYRCSVFLSTIEFMGILNKQNHVAIDGLLKYKFAPMTEYTEQGLNLLQNHHFIDLKHDTMGLNLSGRPRTVLTVDPKIFKSIKTPEFKNTIIKPEHKLRLWKEIASWECIEYLFFQLEELNFEYYISDKLFDLFSELLDSFSLGQIFNIIYHSIHTSLYKLRKGEISEEKAFNYILSIIKLKANNAVKEGYKYHPYTRNINCPESEISLYFFNIVLNLHEDCISKKPNLNLV